MFIKRKDKIEMKIKIIIYTFITSVFLTGCGKIEAGVLDSDVTKKVSKASGNGMMHILIF